MSKFTDFFRSGDAPTQKPQEDAPLVDPEVKGTDSRRLADLKAEQAGQKWRTEAENTGKVEKEYGGPKGLEPTRYGDWEKAGRCYDF